jgi:hypothetical protein
MRMISILSLRSEQTHFWHIFCKIGDAHFEAFFKKHHLSFRKELLEDFPQAAPPD